MSQVWVCLFAVLTAIALVGGTLSGLYIDNGLDQTMIHHSMTPGEKMVVESEILDLLGLPTRPRRPRSQPLNRSAPSFLLDVYKTLAEERQDQARPTRSSHLTLSGEEQQAIDDSDVIITFQSKNHHGESVRHERGRRLWFDVSEAPSGSLVAAELRLYQAAADVSDDSLEEATTIYTIVVHKIISVDTEGGLELEEVASVNTTMLTEGWLELNVTNSFNSWLAAPDTNHGLIINVHPLDEPEHEIKPEEVGVVSTRGSAEKQPFLVAFLQTPTVLGTSRNGDNVDGDSDEDVGGDSGESRSKRETKRKKKDNGYSDNYHLRNPFTETPGHRSSRNCQIQTLYVSFKDLEWQDWIIAPDGYGAFYCSGECNFPLNAHMNATNHAIVQTLVHLINPSQVPKPCCAPTKLTAISVLYFLDDANVILKKYKNMVVKSCGCH